MKMVSNQAGTRVPFEIAVELMDNDLRESIHDSISPCGEQEFFSAYEKAHAEKFGEPWELSKENPTF